MTGWVFHTCCKCEVKSIVFCILHPCSTITGKGVTCLSSPYLLKWENITSSCRCNKKCICLFLVFCNCRDLISTLLMKCTWACGENLHAHLVCTNHEPCRDTFSSHGVDHSEEGSLTNICCIRRNVASHSCRLLRYPVHDWLEKGLDKPFGALELYIKKGWLPFGDDCNHDRPSNPSTYHNTTWLQAHQGFLDFFSDFGILCKSPHVPRPCKGMSLIDIVIGCLWPLPTTVIHPFADHTTIKLCK